MHSLRTAQDSDYTEQSIYTDPISAPDDVHGLKVV